MSYFLFECLQNCKQVFLAIAHHPHLFVTERILSVHVGSVVPKHHSLHLCFYVEKLQPIIKSHQHHFDILLLPHCMVDELFDGTNRIQQKLLTQLSVVRQVQYEHNKPLLAHDCSLALLQRIVTFWMLYIYKWKRSFRGP